MSALESKLRRLVASLDSTALEALASKGLLRRAQKDFERGLQIHLAGETASTLTCTFPAIATGCRLGVM